MSDRYQTSRTLLARARQSLAGGVSSPFRARFPVPLYLRDGCGPRVWDADGNEYIDYTLAWGPLILGHRNPRLAEALRRQAEGPHIYGAQHDLEFEVSERIQRLVPCAARVAFTSSGSEAVQLALRLARAFTGRNLVLRFEGHYHGWMDSVLLSYRNTRDELGPEDDPRVSLNTRGQVPNASENVISAPWNDVAALERQLQGHAGAVAAVIMEPVLCNSGCLMPQPGYLEAAAALARRHGALLIFDEIITGFRMALGGAQAFFGVVPDLATFGKAVAGGVAMSVVAGRAEIMEMIGNGVAFGGTFNGNPLAMAAARVTLDELARDGGAALTEANRLGRALMDGIGRLAARRGIPVAVTGFGAAFAVHFTGRTRLRGYRDTLDDDGERLSNYLRLLLDEAVYLLPDGRCYLSLAHTQREVEETLAAIERVFTSSAFR